MKKLMIILSMLVLLTACGDDKLKTKVCTHVNEGSKTTLTTYYSGETQEVKKIVFELTQMLSADSVQGKSEEQILKSIENIMNSTLSSETQREIEYNHLEKKANIKITFFINQMNEEELAALNLQTQNTINRLTNKFKSLGYTCK